MEKFEIDIDEMAKQVGEVLKPQYEKMLKEILDKNLNQNELLFELIEYSSAISINSSISLIGTYHNHLKKYLEENLKNQE